MAAAATAFDRVLRSRRRSPAMVTARFAAKRQSKWAKTRGRLSPLTIVAYSRSLEMARRRKIRSRSRRRRRRPPFPSSASVPLLLRVPQTVATIPAVWPSVESTPTVATSGDDVVRWVAVVVACFRRPRHRAFIGSPCCTRRRKKRPPSRTTPILRRLSRLAPTIAAAAATIAFASFRRSAPRSPI